MRCPLARLAAAALCAAFATPAAAQTLPLGPDLSLALSGGVQPRVSLGVESDPDGETVRYGAGLRRARIQARVLYRDLVGVEYDVDAGTGSVESVDLFVFAHLAESVEARVGYFPAPQIQGGVVTSYRFLDAVDRPAVVERWLGGTLGSDGRDLGAELALSREGLDAAVAVHNGAGSFSPARGNFRVGLSSPDVTGGTETRGLAASASVRVRPAPGVEVGGFASANGSAPERTARDGGPGRDYLTGGGHAYWGARPGSQPVRLKLDAVALAYSDDGAGAQRAAGVSAFGAVGVRGVAEVFARGERYWNDWDGPADGYLTAGVSVSPSAARGGLYERVRLTAAYQRRDSPTLGSAHLVTVQVQATF